LLCQLCSDIVWNRELNHHFCRTAQRIAHFDPTVL
jgi:hypothetical protein